MLFETVAYFVAFQFYLALRRRFGDPLCDGTRWQVIAAAAVGAAIGSKMLFFLEDPALTFNSLHDPLYFIGGKTIVGGLIGGLIMVELVKRSMGVSRSTGDLFAMPLALGIAVGRVGCFLTGLADHTYGTATALPWGVDFGDGIHRHPTQLYEVVFLLALIPLLNWVMLEANNGQDQAAFRPGDAFKLFMIGYMSFRLLVDAIKPYPRIALGLGTLQWVSLGVLIYYAPDIRRWLSWARSRSESPGKQYPAGLAPDGTR